MKYVTLEPIKSSVFLGRPSQFFAGLGDSRVISATSDVNMASRFPSLPSSTDSDFPGFNPSDVAKAAKRLARKIKYTREEEEYILNASFDSSDEEMPLKRIKDARLERGAIGKRNVSSCGQSKTVSPLHISLTIC